MTLQTALQALLDKGLPRLDAQMILLFALGRSPHDRAWLAAHGTDALTQPEQATLAALAARRLGGEPLAYLIAQREFFGLTLRVTPDVLVPRPETETLVEWALACLEGVPHPRILDLGTGSGAVGLALKHARRDAEVFLVDCSQAALAVACSNACSLGLTVKGLQGNWLEDLPKTELFDVIVSNPPYIAAGDAHLAALAHEPLLALTSGIDGLDAIRTITRQAPQHLRAGGWLLLEHGFDQAARVRELLAAQDFLDVASRHDLNQIERCSGGRVGISSTARA